MFIGHFAVGFAAKRLAPKTSLAVLLAAPLLADMIWPVLVLAGVEHVRIVPGDNPLLVLQLDDYPWSHSLLMLSVWAALGAGLWYVRTRDATAAMVLAAGVLSHWVLDWVTHRPDMPLWPGGPEYGLSLWSSIAGTAVVEGVMFVAAVWMYAAATRATRRRGAIGFWTFVAFLAVAYVANLFSPAPPSATVIGVSAIIATAVCLLWVWWFDRNREPRAA